MQSASRKTNQSICSGRLRAGNYREGSSVLCSNSSCTEGRWSPNTFEALRYQRWREMGRSTEERVVNFSCQVREIQMVLTNNCSEVFAHHFCAFQAQLFQAAFGKWNWRKFQQPCHPKVKNLNVWQYYKNHESALDVYYSMFLLFLLFFFLFFFHAIYGIRIKEYSTSDKRDAEYLTSVKCSVRICCSSFPCSTLQDIPRLTNFPGKCWLQTQIRLSWWQTFCYW